MDDEKPTLPQSIADGLVQFARVGRWGSCVDCPRFDGHAVIEACELTERSDHWLTWESLKEQVERRLNGSSG